MYNPRIEHDAQRSAFVVYLPSSRYDAKEQLFRYGVWVPWARTVMLLAMVVCAFGPLLLYLLVGGAGYLILYILSFALGALLVAGLVELRCDGRTAEQALSKAQLRVMEAERLREMCEELNRGEAA